MNGTGFFSTPHKVPYQPISTRVLIILHGALVFAFDVLRKEHPLSIDLNVAVENEITCRLEHILECNLRQSGVVNGFNTDTFGRICRGTELTNYNNTRISKKPDLLIYLDRGLSNTWSTHDAIYIECKPVDKRHDISRLYCNDGIIRFINGDYAWTMSEGVMIGYIRGDYTISDSLAPVLAQPSMKGQMGYPSAPLSIDSTPGPPSSERLYWTTHNRTFATIDGVPATPIQMFHSWHKIT